MYPYPPPLTPWLYFLYYWPILGVTRDLLQDAVVAAYKRLYINVEISNARSQSLVISR